MRSVRLEMGVVKVVPQGEGFVLGAFHCAITAQCNVEC